MADVVVLVESSRRFHHYICQNILVKLSRRQTAAPVANRVPPPDRSSANMSFADMTQSRRSLSSLCKRRRMSSSSLLCHASPRGAAPVLLRSALRRWQDTIGRCRATVRHTRPKLAGAGCSGSHVELCWSNLATPVRLPVRRRASGQALFGQFACDTRRATRKHLFSLSCAPYHVEIGALPGDMTLRKQWSNNKQKH